MGEPHVTEKVSQNEASQTEVKQSEASQKSVNQGEDIKAEAAAEQVAVPAVPKVTAAAAEKPKKAAPAPDPRVEQAKLIAEQLKTAIVEVQGETAVVEAGAAHIKPMLLINKAAWVDVVQLLGQHPDWQLNYIECMAGTDYKDYIEVVIYIQSTSLGHFVCLKTRTDRENAEVPSLVRIHPGVNWEEREIYDLLGVNFTDHPDMRRIMMWDEFVGHPLRKDFRDGE